MTRGEIGLVLFVFALSWGAQLIPRVGDWIGSPWLRREPPGLTERG